MQTTAFRTEACPDLSIIIVNWNGVQILQDCLASIKENDTDLSYEVIVVDNGSTDGSVSMVERLFPWVRLLCNTDNRGFAAANNQGFELAEGEYLLMLNSDTVILGDVLQESLRFMQRRSEVGIMGCRVLNVDRTLQRTCSAQPDIGFSLLKSTGLHRLGGVFGAEHYVGWQRDSEREVGIVTGCFLLTRRELLEQVGTLDERFFFNYEETDFCLRASRAGWRVVFAPVGEIIHLGGASSGPDNPWREENLVKGKVQFFKKHHAWRAWPIWGLAVAFWAVRTVLAVVRCTRFSLHTAKRVLMSVCHMYPASL